MLFCLEVLVVMPLLRITRLMLLLLMHLQKKKSFLLTRYSRCCPLCGDAEAPSFHFTPRTQRLKVTYIALGCYFGVFNFKTGFILVPQRQQ